MGLTHGIWSFLSDNTVCGQPIVYDHRPRPEGSKGDDLIARNIALELEDITCPTCHKKLEAARATA